jgi:hypothetical protein
MTKSATFQSDITADQDAPSRLAESDDQYPGVVAILNGSWRVIECAAGIQWILQRRAGERHGRARWDARSFCRTKETLIRLCRGCDGEINATAAATLAALPDRFEEKPACHGAAETILRLRASGSQNPVLTAIEAQKPLQNMGPQQALTKGSTPEFSQTQPEAMP